MRVALVIVAMLFCMTSCSRKEIQKGVTNSIGMELVEISAGTFTMGSPEGEEDRQEDEAQVSVTLTKPFGLGKTEVTQGQWKSVMESEPWKGKDFISIFLKNVSGQAGKDCPATYVSWEDAKEFCEKLTVIERESGKLKADEEYRLPTEAEWEYSCRAGTETAFSFGDDESKLGKYAWFEGNPMNFWHVAHMVGLKKTNPWSLHDMHGNVHEWCSDWYGDGLSGGTDPIGPEEGSDRVFRGGSWWNDPGFCRSAFRGNGVPSNRHDVILGFRVARSQSKTVTVAERRLQGAQAEPTPQVAVETRPMMEKPEPLEEDFKSGESVTNSIGMELIELPAGKFTMGSDIPAGGVFNLKGKKVSVTLTKPFGLGKTEVTQGQWKSVMGSEPWKSKDQVKADKDCPATYVAYFSAVEFCEKLTELERESGKLKANEEYRLPTEAEWEYACRAGTETAFSFGDDESKLGEYGWFEGNAENAGEKYAHIVGKKKPNPWGLHDMHGNVAEWCSDWHDLDLSGGTDPVGPVAKPQHVEGMLANRVIRGGSYDEHPVRCRSANRGSSFPSLRTIDLGFRVARSQSETVTRPVMEKTEPVKKGFKGEIVTNSIGMELIELPAGKFTMGSPEGEKNRNENWEAQVSVTLTKPFGLGKYEVTQGQWQQVMGIVFQRQIYNVEYKNFPASTITWDEATEFCEKLTATEHKDGKLAAGESYRLPTEAEWEYACRAGTETAFSFGDDESKLGEYAWFVGNIGSEQPYAYEVGLKKPNPWGLYDMHGNVEEWCSDELNSASRVIRGGGSGSYPGICRSARCGIIPPLARGAALGFRVARSQLAQ